MTSPGSALTRWWRKIAHADRETVALVLIVKALLLIFAVQTFTASAEAYPGALAIWDRWDATHYLHLSEHGYAGAGKDRVLLAFFPFYPWLVRACAFVVRDTLTAAFVVSGIASIAAALLLRRLSELDQSPSVARASVWFLAIFPTTYFLHIPYTESLFLALTLGCIVAARRDQWMLAGVLGGCAALTRINGLVLIPVLVTEAFLVWRSQRRFDPRWLASGAVGVGFLGYLWLNQHVAGDPLAFAHIQEQHWYHTLTPPWVGISQVWLRIGDINAIESLHEFIYIVLTLVCTVWCWVKLRPSYAVWMTCNWLLITCNSFIISVPRYALTFFPIFILLARLCTGRPLAFGSVTLFSVLFLALYVQRFVHRLWAF